MTSLLKSAICVFLLQTLLFGCAQPSITNTQTVIVQNQTTNKTLEQVSVPEPNITIVVANTTPETTTAPSENTRTASNFKEFNVEAFQFGYEPDEIRVKQGDHVKIRLSTRDVGHSLNIREYGINIPAQPGIPGVKEFIADKKGTFTWHCRIPCGHSHGSMSGTFVVE